MVKIYFCAIIGFLLTLYGSVVEAYDRIPLQPVPLNAETRDGVYVYRPYMFCDFFSDADVDGEEELFEEANAETNKYYGFIEDYFGGCSIWCGVAERWTTKASSTLSNMGDISYSSDNLLSLLRENAWCEGARGYGIGEYIEIFYTLGYYLDMENNDEAGEKTVFDFSSLCIVNGYAKTEELWQENSRVKTLKMFVNGELKGYIELEDTITPQYFILYDVSGISCVETVFRFEIADVYEGSLYDDVCLTGIVFGFTGFDVH